MEDFPNTPIIPIDDFSMKQYQQAIARRKSKGFSFEINKSKIWNGILFLSSAVIILVFVRFLLRIEEEMLYDYERLKIRRYGNAPRNIREDQMSVKTMNEPWEISDD